MEKKLLPSERLQARLSAMGQPTPRANDDPSLQFIEMAEDTFADPMRVISASWTKQDPDPFLFSRPAHEFSEMEAFAFKLVMVLAGLGAIDRDNAEHIIATITYADGKANVRRVAPPMIGHQFPEYHQLSTFGHRNQIPPSFSGIAPEISRLAALARECPSPAVRAWVAKYVGSRPGEIHASALFSDQPDPLHLPLGLNAQGQLLYYRGEASLLTVAPPGKGKTQCHILPTLQHYRGPAIVLDIKGECFANTAEWRKQHVGPVLRFNPVEPGNSSRYNPIAFVDADPDELWESSRFLADLLVVVQSQSDATWESQGKELLTLIIAFVVSAGEPHERTMATVLDFVATIDLEDMLEHVKAPESGYPGAMRRTAARFSQMASNAPKQFEGVLGGASQHLQVWEGPKVEKVTTGTDWRPEDFRNAPYPTLYLCIPPNAVETYSPLLRVIVGQHVRRLMQHHEKTSAPVLFLLDELPRLGKMEPIREALEVGRSYGIKLWMIAQYPEQLLQAYPGVGDGMMDSCDVRMYMNPSAATAEKIEKAFGKANNIFNKKETAHIAATEILGPNHRDSIFVLASGEQPLILKKKFFHRNSY
ncbi:type IV secretory system conjugative DNA transfer family protein (plasmid) [Labrenzia sp. 5N]|uniref:type IV secretory system conjugative DNA transfer family protein n=1 Tax=Labrenzia sp. 5N TaxID=2723402 RepID=UPI0014466CFE|nr:type IV secretory system conjugative DNA transfer family protein [Labrenzia sp. 5N]NKX68282.1 type IV secretory system conjugative DNA transfer family protein [Labrenzia sp. 5N]